MNMSLHVIVEALLVKGTFSWVWYTVSTAHCVPQCLDVKSYSSIRELLKNLLHTNTLKEVS